MSNSSGELSQQHRALEKLTQSVGIMGNSSGELSQQHRALEKLTQLDLVSSVGAGLLLRVRSLDLSWLNFVKLMVTAKKFLVSDLHK